MINKKDILDYININYPDTLNNINLFKKTIINEIINVFNIISDNKNDIQLKAEKYFIESIIDEYSNKINTFNIRKHKLYELMKLELPEQRSPEWYKLRQNILTASSFAAALGDDHFKSRDMLIYEKINPPPYTSNPITEWGVKYEEIATLFYQLITGTNVIEFGLIPHPTFPIFGASPDGICDDKGPMEYCSRMLEIKCPPKRKFTKSVPKHYMMQMQGQLEVCDLDECDFLQVKIEEYEDMNEYKKDTLNLDEPLKYSYPDIKGYDTNTNGKTHQNLPKGCTISYIKKGDDDTKYSYLYPKLLLSDDEYLNWIDGYIKQGLNIIETKWWKITRYEITLVHRDKPWWNNHIEHVLKFYNDYIHYKENISELENIVKNDKKEVTINIPEKLPGFLLCD